MKLSVHFNDKYLLYLIPQENQPPNTLSNTFIPKYYCWTDLFKYSFVPLAINEWKKLNLETPNIESLLSLRKTLLRIDRSSPKSILNIDNPNGLKLLTRLRFSHNFSNWVDPWCFCSLETESLSLFFLQCHLFRNIRLTYLEEFTKINLNILNVCENSIVEVLL